MSESEFPATLASLAGEAAEISRLLLESQGEISPELEARLAVNEQSLMQKADAYSFIIDEMEAQAALWKRRKDACAAQQKKFEGRVEQMKTRIKEAMRAMGTTEIRGGLHGFQLRRSKPKLIIENEAALPADCKMVVQTTVVDKEKVTAALVSGFPVAGARLEEGGALHSIDVAGRK